MTHDVFAAAWLRDVPPAVLERLRTLGKVISFEDRGVVYGLGADQRWLWSVVIGQVRVEITLNEMEPVLGHIHQTGAWFGESEPLLGVPGLVEMRASGKTSVLRIDYAAYRALANEHPELWEALARLTSMNQLLAMTAANDLGLRTGRMRLAAVLLRLGGFRANLQRSATSLTIPASQTEVANLANVSLSKASEELNRFAGTSIVRLEYGRIVILDPQELRRVIDP